MRILLSLALGAAALACNKQELSGCSVNADCPSGNICEKGTCYELCDDDLDCVVGFICNGDFCERGEREPPTIERVTGNGTANCPQARDGLCFADGLIVYGTNLTGSQFSLNSLTGGLSFSLALGARREATRMDLFLPPDLVEDDYLLVAMNSAGEAQATTNILQGEPGVPANMSGDEVVDLINQTPYTSRIVTQRLPVANDLITHLNTGSTQLDPAILPPGGGNYTGNDIVNLINTGGTTQIDAARLATSDTLLARINSATGTVLIGRLPVGTTAGTVAAGDHTHPGGGASQFHRQRTAATAGSAEQIDDATLLALCGDNEGCDMRVGYRYFNNGGDLL
ncbi:MAG: hypothetical protein HYZ27_04990, partial [Deltaproteobacteria bacterium]|nr:hypothetical protein [Deltaproteobacteria bacterium]